MGAPRVSAVIANWNGAEHLRICLPSLLSQSLNSLEIIVVDNRSSDDSESVAKSFGARWLPLAKNLGLAPALNFGAATALGDFLLFVNNDMRFDPQFLANLVAPFDADPEIFATDGMQFNWDGTVRGHVAARLSRDPSEGNGSTKLVPGLFFYQREEANASPVFMGSAACIMIRRNSFEKLRGFDERLLFGYEDVEICWRAWLYGYKILYIPQAICWHHVSASQRSSEGARMGFQGVVQGRLLFATKLLPTRYAIKTWLTSIAGLARDLLHRKWSFALVRIKVLLHVTGLAGQLLREKKALFREANVSPEEQLEKLIRLTSDGNHS